MEHATSHPRFFRAPALWILCLAVLAVFAGRTLLAARGGSPPRLNDIFTALALVGSLAALTAGWRVLRWSDWLIAAVLGVVVGAGMAFATLFSAYPFLGIIRDTTGQAIARGLFVTLAALGGQVIMRQGGPVQLLADPGAWRKNGRSILTGLAVGLPLAVINVFALQFTAGHAIAWQNPLAAALDALQPAVVEEIIYRFALWGLFWLVLRGRLSGPAAATASGLLATLVHAGIHLDELLIQSPLTALGMGLVMGIVWGLPPFLLARRRGLESAIAFHWLQDFARFAAGF